jgi:hypothetical protein
VSDVRPSERILLKILSGVQAGAEVALAPGEYSIGSGADDDIQFVDVSLKVRHAKLRVSPGKIEISGDAGPLRTANGLTFEAGSEWQEVEPLDIVTAGTMRFALGPPTANWTTLTDDVTTEREDVSRLGKQPPKSSPEAGHWSAVRRLAVPATVLIALFLVTILFVSFGSGGRIGATFGTQQSDLEAARAALDQFPFGRTVSLNQEVDGTIFATGFVESAVERRALLGAIEKTRIPVRFRVGVLQALRTEIDSLIKDEKVAVSFSLSSAGELSLDGVILNEANAKKFVDEIQGLVVGLKRIDSRIRTAKTLLDDIEKLARMSQIENLVIFRLDGELVEASGILPTDKIDSWVGFLQSYARRFGKDIALRSLVQLQNPNGTLVGDAGGSSKADRQAILLGGDPNGSNDTKLDLERLARGEYDLSDVFVGAGKGTNPADAAKSTTSAALSSPPALSLADERPTLVSSQEELKPPVERFDADHLSQEANNLIQKWKAGRFSGDEANRALNSVEAARARNGRRDGYTAADYLPLIPRDAMPRDIKPCRPDSRLTPENLPTALFWLDMLSVSTEMSMTTFEREEQGFVLEAALNPRLVASCLGDAGAAKDAAATSLYLAEAARNPDFIRFLTRNLPPFTLDISGVDTTGSRYVQLRDGSKVPEGASPDVTSRLTLVGELGVALQIKSGYAVVAYGPEVNWKLQK